MLTRRSGANRQDENKRSLLAGFKSLGNSNFLYFTGISFNVGFLRAAKGALSACGRWMADGVP